MNLTLFFHKLIVPLYFLFSFHSRLLILLQSLIYSASASFYTFFSLLHPVINLLSYFAFLPPLLPYICTHPGFLLPHGPRMQSRAFPCSVPGLPSHLHLHQSRGWQLMGLKATPQTLLTLLHRKATAAAVFCFPEVEVTETSEPFSHHKKATLLFSLAEERSPPSSEGNSLPRTSQVRRPKSMFPPPSQWESKASIKRTTVRCQLFTEHLCSCQLAGGGGWYL